jgi:SOS-response transcriptional repressor LexA
MLMNTDKIAERQQRAERLALARIRSKLGGTKKVSARFGWNQNTYKSHDSGRTSFGLADAKKYARAFGVSTQWLYMGIGEPDDIDPDLIQPVDVPLVSWVSAGQMDGQDGISDFSDCPVISTLDLPEGDWIALRVEGESMNRVSPPGSIIFVNCRDRRLVANGCYVITDETGAATYKRYRPSEDPPFRPASTEDIEPPELSGAVKVVGRVRRTMLEM